MRQRLLWTALPAGTTDDGRLRLSVLVSPSLIADGNTRLDQWPDFWGDEAWPRKDVRFSVAFRGVAGLLEAERLTSPDAKVWDALFESRTLVRHPGGDDLSAARVRSFPARSVVEELCEMYGRAGRELAGSPPPRGRLLEAGLGRFVVGGTDPKTRESQLLSELEAELRAAGAVPSGDPAHAGNRTPLKDFLLVKRFHRAAAQKRPGERLQPDFHELVSIVSEYPFLLRELGLVVDLAVPRPDGLQPDETGVAAGQVAVVPALALAGTPTRHVRPWTHCLLNAFDVFVPRPRADSDLRLVHGPGSGGIFLDVADRDTFFLYDVDADGSALKVLATAGSAEKARVAPAPDTPPTETLPALRSRGIALGRQLRAESLKSELPRPAELDRKADIDGAVVELWADDVVQGFRPDVYDHRRFQWRPLCRRTGRYRFPQSGLIREHPATAPGGFGRAPRDPDEAWVSEVVREAEDGTGDLYVGETVFAWHGWSLAAPRPGRIIGQDETPADTPPDDSPLRVEFAARDLPKLRFGRRYSVRARAVDLAGNGPGLDPFQSPDPLQSQSIVYRRYEPVAPPAVVMQRPRTAGESVHRLVVRSDGLGGAAGVSARHLFPPKASQLLCEQHGTFDRPDGSLDAAAYDLIVLREAGSLVLHDAESDDPRPPDGAPPWYGIDPSNHAQPYYDTDRPEFVLSDGSTARVPYLPDPLATRLGLRDLPGGRLDPVSWYPRPLEWPKAVPARLVLSGGDAPPRVDGDAIHLELPPGCVHTIRLSTALAATGGAGPQGESLDDQINQLGVAAWMAGPGDGGPTQLPAQQRNEAADGANWLLTPDQTLTLVHAVRVPLLPPLFLTPDLGLRPRARGDAHAAFGGALAVSRRSTSRLDVIGTWTEHVDDPTASEPKLIATSAPAFGIEVAHAGGGRQEFRLELAGLVAGPGARGDRGTARHELGDTKRRAVTYSATAVTRFAEYFTEVASPTLRGSAAATVHPGPVAARTESVRAASSDQVYERGRDYVMRYGAPASDDAPARPATIARAQGGSIPDGATVTVSFVPEPVSRSTPPESVQVVDLPSTARPARPDIAYSLPTFGWSEQADAGWKHGAAARFLSRRDRSGVRIYLNRPWWSSGEGELLAVILPEVAGAPADGATARLVSGLSKDPARLGAAAAVLQPGMFPRAVRSRAGLTSGPARGLRAVGHEVSFDRDRRLWYCDVEVTPRDNAIFPFLRLALARFQPVSVAGEELSGIVVADYVQLSPVRTAGVSYDPADPRSVHVDVVGPSWAGHHTLPSGSPAVGTADGDLLGPGELEVVVQVHDPSIADESLSWRDDETTRTLLPAAHEGGFVYRWSGRVALGAERAARPMRLQIVEREVFKDNRDAVERRSDRVVYADHIDLRFQAT